MESLHWLFKSPGALPTMYIAPTWSWASSTAPIQYDSWDVNDMELMAEVVDIECTPAGVDRCGRVSSGYVVLRGPVGLVQRGRNATFRFKSGGEAGSYYPDYLDAGIPLDETLYFWSNVWTGWRHQFTPECLPYYCNAAHCRKIHSRGSDFSGTIFPLPSTVQTKVSHKFSPVSRSKRYVSSDQALELLELCSGRCQKVCASRLRARTFEGRQLRKSHDLVKTGVQT